MGRELIERASSSLIAHFAETTIAMSRMASMAVLKKGAGALSRQDVTSNGTEHLLSGAPGRTRTCMHGLSGHCLHPGISRTPNLSATGANYARALLQCEFAIFVRGGTEGGPWRDPIMANRSLG